MDFAGSDTPRLQTAVSLDSWRGDLELVRKLSYCASSKRAISSNPTMLGGAAILMALRRRGIWVLRAAAAARPFRLSEQRTEASLSACWRRRAIKALSMRSTYTESLVSNLYIKISCSRQLKRGQGDLASTDLGNRHPRSC